MINTSGSSTISNAPYAFQNKNIPAEALVQSKHWYDKAGNLYEIKSMSPKHARGAFGKLTTAYGPGGANSPLGVALWNRASD